MADVATTSGGSDLQSSPKSTAVKKERKNKSDRPKASHPSTAIMVNNAIQNLKERGGSSLQAIKKYISATYKVDAEKFAPFIKKYIKSSVVSGALVQTKGKGASGSFKLASTAVTKKSVSGAAAAAGKSRKSSTTTTKSKPKERKTTVVKKSSVASKTTKSRKSATLEKQKSTSAKIAKPKSPSKVKKTTKAPTKKPKSPKPKTTKPKVVKKKATSPKKK